MKDYKHEHLSCCFITIAMQRFKITSKLILAVLGLFHVMFSQNYCTIIPIPVVMKYSERSTRKAQVMYD